MSTSPLPSQGTKTGQKCYVTPAFSRVPNAKRGEQNEKWLPHPCVLGGPKRRRKCYVTPTFSGIPNTKRGEQKQKWSTTKGNNNKPDYLTPTFSGAQKRGEMLGLQISGGKMGGK